MTPLSQEKFIIVQYIFVGAYCRNFRLYFADFQETYFSEELKKLEHGWVKYVELKGEYIEK